MLDGGEYTKTKLTNQNKTHFSIRTQIPTLIDTIEHDLSLSISIYLVRLFISLTEYRRVTLLGIRTQIPTLIDNREHDLSLTINIYLVQCRSPRWTLVVTLECYYK